MRAKILGGLIVVILTVLGWCGINYYQALTSPAVGQKAIVEIAKGDTFAAITQKLLAQNINIKPLWFKVIAYQQKVINRLKPGEYELMPGLSSSQILAQFAEGKSIRYSVTFPEGWSLKEILHTLAKTPNLEQTLANVPVSELSAKLGMTEKNPEGWLFPDTYYFEKHNTDLSILMRAHAKMQEVLNDEWQQKAQDLPYKTPYEALVMASIVEKETGAKVERPLIAGVFIRRLTKGILLQTDPTVIYGMGDNYKGNIRASDLTGKTPYNTYVIAGLPPTPIAMPGSDAIHAALHPEKGDSLYFVAKGDGSHQFSATLEAHNQAVNVYQKHRR
ncbi:MAG: endolytic transglycosylase MltG [Gammaproteobacteria bacterium]|nr:endolytic transglycosylase MltG [Gammaproteobacteria bacterium]